MHRKARAIAHQTASSGELAVVINGGDFVACRQGSELIAAAGEERIGNDDEGAGPLLHDICKGYFKIAFAAGVNDAELLSEQAGCFANISKPPFGARRVRIHEYGNGASSRNQFAKQFHALRLQGGGKKTPACQVATWSIEACRPGGHASAFCDAAQTISSFHSSILNSLAPNPLTEFDDDVAG